MWASSQFVASTGISDMSLYRQCGRKEEHPVFPYSLRYEPNPELSYEDEEYTTTVFEQLRRVESGKVLYKVYARDAPASLGGQE